MCQDVWPNMIVDGVWSSVYIQLLLSRYQAILQVWTYRTFRCGPACRMCRKDNCAMYVVTTIYDNVGTVVYLSPALCIQLEGNDLLLSLVSTICTLHTIGRATIHLSLILHSYVSCSYIIHTWCINADNLKKRYTYM